MSPGRRSPPGGPVGDDDPTLPEIRLDPTAQVLLDERPYDESYRSGLADDQDERRSVGERLKDWQRHYLPLPDEVIDDYLATDEYVIHMDHPSFRAFLTQNLLPVVGLGIVLPVLFMFLWNGGMSWQFWVLVLVLDAVLGFLVFKRVSDRYTNYVITNLRLIRLSGVVSRKLASIAWTRMTGVGYSQSLWGRFLGYATIHLESANEESGLRRFSDINDPESFHQQILDMISGKTGQSEGEEPPPPTKGVRRSLRKRRQDRRAAVEAKRKAGRTTAEDRGDAMADAEAARAAARSFRVVPRDTSGPGEAKSTPDAGDRSVGPPEPPDSPKPPAPSGPPESPESPEPPTSSRPPKSPKPPGPSGPPPGPRRRPNGPPPAPPAGDGKALPIDEEQAAPPSGPADADLDAGDRGDTGDQASTRPAPEGRRGSRGPRGGPRSRPATPPQGTPAVGPRPGRPPGSATRRPGATPPGREQAPRRGPGGPPPRRAQPPGGRRPGESLPRPPREGPDVRLRRPDVPDEPMAGRQAPTTRAPRGADTPSARAEPQAPGHAEPEAPREGLRDRLSQWWADRPATPWARRRARSAEPPEPREPPIAPPQTRRQPWVPPSPAEPGDSGSARDALASLGRTPRPQAPRPQPQARRRPRLPSFGQRARARRRPSMPGRRQLPPGDAEPPSSDEPDSD